MASDEDRCTNYPDFAIICSFIENFDDKVKLTFPDIDELQILLEDTDNVNPLLAKLIGQLLRRINKSVKFDKWERGLQRFAHSYSHQDGWELERFGFKKAKLECKIRVFRNLLESQFDLYKSFKDKVNLVSAKDLRLQPCGRDKHGVAYWCQLDKFANLRIYKDDQDDETWTLVARSREELVSLIDDLQAASPPRSLARETSVEESQSEATTPMVLSEAPTPVDSKAATPVTSGRTSPVLDTGQRRDKLKCDSIEVEEINDSEIKKISLLSASDSEDNGHVDKGGTSLNTDVKEDIKKTLLDESKCMKIKERKNSSEKRDSFSEKLHESSALENIPEVYYKEELDLLGDASQKEVVKSVKEAKLSKTEIIHDSVPLKRESEKMLKNLKVSSSKEIETPEQVLPISLKDLGQQLKEEVPEKSMLATGQMKSSAMKALSKQISVPSSEQENKSLVHSTQDVHTKISNQDIQQPCKKQLEDAVGKESVTSVKNTLAQLSKIHVQEQLHSDKSKAAINSSKDLKAVCKDNDTVIKNLSGQLSDKISMDVSHVSVLPTAAKLQDVATTDVKKKPVSEQTQIQDRKTIFRSLPINYPSSDVAQDLSMHSVSQGSALYLSDTKDNSKFIERNVASEKRNYFPKKETIKELENEKIDLSVDAVLLSPHLHSQQKCNVLQTETSQRYSNVALNLTSPRKILNIDKTKLEKESQQLIQDKFVGQGKDKPEKKTIDQIFSLSKSKHFDHIVTSGSDYVDNARKESQQTNFSSIVVDLSATKPMSLLAKSTKLETPKDLSKLAHMPLKSNKEQILEDNKLTSSSILSIKPDIQSKVETVNTAEQKKISPTMQSSDLSRISDISNIDKIKSSDSNSIESKSEEICASTKRIPKQNDDTMNHEKIVSVTSTGKESIKCGGTILEKEKVEPEFHSSMAPCKSTIAVRKGEMSSEEPKAGSIISMTSEIHQLDSDTRIVKPVSHKINDNKQLKSDKVSSKGPSQLDTVSLDPKSLSQMESAVSTDNIEPKSTVNQKLGPLKNSIANEPLKTDMVTIKEIDKITTTGTKLIKSHPATTESKESTSPMIGESNMPGKSNSIVDNKILKSGSSESKEFIKSVPDKKELAPTVSIASKAPTIPASVAGVAPTLPVSVASKEPTLPVPIESKVPTTPVSVASKESTTPMSVSSKEPRTPVSVASKKSTMPVSVASKKSTTPVSVARKMPTTPASVASKESTTLVSVSSKEPTSFVSVANKESTTPVSVATIESTTHVSVASKEPTMPESVACRDPTTPVSVASKELIIPATVASKEPITPVSVASKEPVIPESIASKRSITHVSVANKEPIAPASIASKQPITPVSVARKEPITPESIASKQSITPVSVASKEPSKAIAKMQTAKSSSVTNVELVKSVSSSEPTNSMSVSAGNMKLATSLPVEIKEPQKSLLVASNEPTKLSNKRVEPFSTLSIESKESLKSSIVEGQKPTTMSPSNEGKEPKKSQSSEILKLNKALLEESDESTISLSSDNTETVKFSSTELKPFKTINVESKEFSKSSSISKEGLSKSLPFKSKDCAELTSVASNEASKSVSVLISVTAKSFADDSKEPSKSVAVATKELINHGIASSKLSSNSDYMAMTDSIKHETVPDKICDKPVAIPVACNESSKSESIVSMSSCKSDTSNNTVLGSKIVTMTHDVMLLTSSGKEGDKSAICSNKLECKSSQVICEESTKPKTKASNDLSKNLTVPSSNGQLKLSAAITSKETNTEAYKVGSVAQKGMEKSAASVSKDTETSVMRAAEESPIPLPVTVACKESTKSSSDTQKEEIKSEASKELLKNLPVVTKAIIISEEFSSKPHFLTSEKLNKSKIIPYEVQKDTSYKDNDKSESIAKQNLTPKETTNSVAVDKPESNEKQNLASKSITSLSKDSSKLGSLENKVSTNSNLKLKHDSSSRVIKNYGITKNLSCKFNPFAKIDSAEGEPSTFLESMQSGEVNSELNLSKDETIAKSILVGEDVKSETMLSKESIDPKVVTSDLAENVKKDKLKDSHDDKVLSRKSESDSSIGHGNLSSDSAVNPIKSDLTDKSEAIKSIAVIHSETHVDPKLIKSGSSVSSESCHTQSVARKGNSSSELRDVDEHCKLSSIKAVCQETSKNNCDLAAKVTDNKPESLLKNSNVTKSVSCRPSDCQNESVDKDVVSDPVDLKDVSTDAKASDSKGQDLESELGETIEETLMIVTGDGEGALCEGGNYFIDSDVSDGNLNKDSNCFCNNSVDKNNLKCNCTYYRELAGLHVNDTLPSASAIPWWENFEFSCSEQFTNNVDVIEEKIQYFWGEGSGADCDAGNSGDEKEGTVISTRSTRRNTRSTIKKPEVVETTLGDTSNESKLNGVKNNCQQNDIAVPSKVGANSTSPDVQNVDAKSCGKSNSLKLIKENKKPGKDKVAIDSKEYVKSNTECENSLDKMDGKEIPENNISETVIGNEAAKKEKVEVLKNQELSKTKTEVDQSVSECDNQELKCDNEDILEENVAVKKPIQRVGSRGRGRPKKGRRRGILKRGRSASNDENKDEIEDSSEDEDGKKGRLRGRGRSDISAFDEGPSHRQRSARIAKIREREETERRELEAQQMRQMAEEHRLKELKKKARLERRALREIKKTKKEKKKDKKKKKKKKKIKKKAPTGTDPWNHSSSSSSSSSEEDELEMEEEDNEELVFKSDHEFSPESDIGEEDAQPIKRARTARKSDIVTKEAIVYEEDSDYDDTQCVKCGHEDHPETILLCDSCDNGWHISCLRPPLFSVPEGDWSCPTCEHALLIEKLKEILDHYDATKKRAETEELRKQRLAYINVSLDNVIPDKKKKHKHKEDEGSESDSDESDSDSESGSESSSSTGADSDSSSPALYTLRARPSRTPKEQVENFDELINEAIRDEMEAALMSKKTPVCRGKDISTIVEGEKEDVYEDEEEEKEEEEEVGKGTGKEMRIEEEEKERRRKNEIKTEKNKEIELPKLEVKEELPKEKIVTPKKEVRIAEDDDEEVAPKRKKKKLNDDEEAEKEDAGSEYEVSEPDTPPNYNKKKRMGNKAMMASKKRRRLTDLDVEEDEDDSDEDFMGTSEEDEEEEDASDAASSDFESESESDDSGGGRGRSGRYGIVPLRRSTRNTRNASMEDYDSDDKKSKRQKKKKKKKRKFSSSDDEEYSSDSEGSYAKKRKAPRKRSVSSRRYRGSKKSSSKKKKGSRKPQNKKRKVEVEGEEGEEKLKPKPRIKYSKPPKTKEEQQEEVSQRRVTRGRQINYYNSLLMSDEEFDDEEEKPKSRGKVMKGERISESSSEFEVSDDERKKRRGVSGGLGRGKVMKGEEEDEDYGKKKKKAEESPLLRGKPKSAILPPKLLVESADAQKPISTNIEKVTSEAPQKISSEEKCVTPSNPILIKGPPSINQAPIRMTVNRPGALPTPTLIRGGGPGSRPRHPTPLQSHLEAKMYSRPAAPSGSRFPHASQIQIATSPTPIVSGISSSVSITPVSYVPNPNAPHAQSHIRPNNSVTMTPRGPSPRGPRPQISMPPSIPSHVTITRGPRGPPPAPNITATTGRISPPVTPSRGPTSLPSTTNGNRLPLTTSVSKVEIKGSSAPPHPMASVALANLPIIPVQSASEIPAERQALPVIASSAKKGGPLGRVSPGPLPSIGKWSPHITGGNSGSNTPPHHGLASGTPPHPNIGGAINSSPPPPYRLSPIPVSISGTGPPNAITHRSTPPNMSPVSVHSTGYPPPSTITHRSTPPNISSTSTHPTGYPPSTIAHRSTPPNLPTTTVHPSSYPPPSTISHRSTPPNIPPSTTHPSGYPPYPPPEHFGPHPGYPPGYHPGAALSPGPHGPPLRHNLPHPGSINAGHPMYGPPVSHASSYQSLPPHHPGILRGPIHELYRQSPPSHPRPLLLKQGYPGLEPLPFAGSPGPIDVSGGRHSSPGPPISSKEPQAPPNKKPASNEGEFSSGLMSYFSSQREDDVE